MHETKSKTDVDTPVLKKKLPFSWLIVAILFAIIIVSYLAQEFVTSTLNKANSLNIESLELAEESEKNAKITHSIIIPMNGSLRQMDRYVTKFQSEIELLAMDPERSTDELIKSDKKISDAVTYINKLDSRILGNQITESLSSASSIITDITLEVVETNNSSELQQLLEDSTDVIEEFVTLISQVDSILNSRSNEISKATLDETKAVRLNVEKQKSNVIQLDLGIKWTFVIISIIVVIAFMLFNWLLHQRLASIANYADEISEGNFNTYINFTSKDKIGSVAHSVTQMGQSLFQLVNTAKKQAKVAELAKAEAEEHSWLSESLRILAESTYSATEPHKMAENAIEMMSRQLGLAASEILLVENNRLLPVSKINPEMESESVHFPINEGIFGQVIKSKEALMIEGTKDSSLNVSTGLLKGTPDIIYLSPLVFDDEVTGVIELGFIQAPTHSQIEFINHACKLVAFSIHAVEHMKNEELLSVEKEKFNALKKLSLKLEKANKKAKDADRSKSAFLANMSHEMRTPLTAIIGFGEILQYEKAANEHQQRSIDGIVNSGKHLLDLINDILDISKIVANEIEILPKNISVHQILNEIKPSLEVQAESRGLEFTINYEPEITEQINTDPFRLKQILMNLCDNAIKFTTQGFVKINVSMAPEADSIIFEIVDSGVGLNEEQREHIFDVFEQADSSSTRRYGGTGLGLSLSNRLCHMLGGDITVESEPDEGSCFRVSIATGLSENVISSAPFENDNIEQVAVKTHMTPESLTGNVLVAEDTELNQDLIALYLETLELNFTIVENGKLALNKALQEDFDLIIMDMQMPVMDGVTATKELRKKGFDKPIIALTANAMNEDRETFMAAGCDEFVTKPIDQDHLDAIMATYLSNKKSTPNIESLTPILPIIKKQSKSVDKIRLRFVNEALLSYFAEIKAAFDNNDWQLFKDEIHKLKGTGGNFGYPMLTEQCLLIEQLIPEKNADKISPLIVELHTICLQIVAGIKVYSAA